MAPLKGQFGQTVAFLEYTEMENASLGIGGGSSTCFLGFKPPVPPQQLSGVWEHHGGLWWVIREILLRKVCCIQ